MYFKGATKIGKNRSPDYRFFSGFILLLPLLIYSTLTFTQSNLFFCFNCIWVLIYLCLHLVFKPFRHPTHNYTMIAMLTATLGLLWAGALDNIHFSLSVLFPAAMALLSLSIPFFYLLGLGCVLTKSALKGLISYCLHRV